ncbi:MAG: tyrosine-type recombinase/integrase [Burkholderiales bacterium]|nr:tyrosine-type recombinase/integrase [Burkholderiales bacterium]
MSELKAIPSEWRGDALRDGDGLVGVVRFVAGDSGPRVHFRYEYKRGGKKTWHYCGTWPAASLDAVRRARDEARGILRRGLDPNAKRDADRIEAREQVKATLVAEARRRVEDASVRELYEVWLRDGVLRKDGNAALKRSFEADVLPSVGTKPVRSVTEHDVRVVLRALVARGVNRTAVEVHRNIKQMFRWAEKRQPWRRLLQDGNPAELVEIAKIVDPDYDLSNIRSRVLNDDELRELRDRLEAMARDYEAAPDKRRALRPVEPETQAALWLCLCTLCRIGELLMTEWRHVDLEAGTWFVPKENVKGSRGKKRDHFVYLSPFALRHFRALQARTGGTRWCFPGRDATNHVDVKSVSKQIGDRQHRFKQRKALANRRNDNSLVLSNGANGEWTPHDLRRTGATMMQALGVMPDVIDRCQNHVLACSRVRRHYLTHDYADETKQAWAKLGAAIEAALARPLRLVSRSR